MKILSDLFIVFFKIGLFTFGGGYAMLALIEDICVEKKKWITHEEMMDITVIAESTPGPIAINLATYVGYKLRKIPGALISTLAVVLPAFLIIVLVTAILRKFISNRYFQAILSGMKPCIIGIIMAMGIYLMVQNCFGSNFSGIDIMAVIMAILLGVVYWGSRKIKKNGISPILLIIISAGSGVLCYGFR